MYRETDSLGVKHYNFTLHNGGLGDAIAQMPAIKYILDNHPQVFIHLWCHDYFVELAKKCFKDRKNIVIRGLSDYKTKYKQNQQARSPYAHKTQNLACHLTDHAFFTLTYSQVENKHKNYIQIEPIDVTSFQLPEKYICITTGFTSMSREWLPESVNGVTDYIIQKGYTPVYLGKGYTHSYQNIGITGNFKADYSRGVNLIDKTTLLEAHAIMNSSKAVLGLDNGLLHLAGMGKAPIVAGFTTVLPEHRLPYREGKLGHNCFVVVPKELECFGCQSNMTFADSTHSFTDCFYKDYKCLSLMTADKWIAQLEKALNPPLTPQQKAEEAYQTILRTQELNQKLKELGITAEENIISTYSTNMKQYMKNKKKPVVLK